MTAPHNSPVLLCYDGSDGAEQAIHGAAALMGRRSAIVLHVGARGETLAATGRDVARAAGFDPVSLASERRGPVAGAILARADAAGVDAIVVGSRGRSGSGPPILGSVSRRVADRARRPVLIVPPGPHRERVQRPVFVCYDGSHAADGAIATAGALLAARQAIVAYFLPSVDDGVVLQSTLPWSVSEATREALAAVDREEALHPLDVAARGVELAERAGLRARSLPVGDEGLAYDEEAVAWVALGEAAVAESASCIVVGHRRSSAGGPLHVGSTAYGLVDHANRPVLVVPAD